MRPELNLGLRQAVGALLAPVAHLPAVAARRLVADHALVDHHDVNAGPREPPAGTEAGDAASDYDYLGVVQVHGTLFLVVRCWRGCAHARGGNRKGLYLRRQRTVNLTVDDGALVVVG